MKPIADLLSKNHELHQRLNALYDDHLEEYREPLDKRGHLREFASVIIDDTKLSSIIDIVDTHGIDIKDVALQCQKDNLYKLCTIKTLFRDEINDMVEIRRNKLILEGIPLSNKMEYYKYLSIKREIFYISKALSLNTENSKGE